MSKLKAISLTICISMVPYQLASAKYDGSVPLLCAPIQAIECGVEDDCHRGTADSVDIPQFLKIDFEEKIIMAADESEKKAIIKSLEHVDGKMIMQGTQNGRGWTMVIRKNRERCRRRYLMTRLVLSYSVPAHRLNNVSGSTSPNEHTSLISKYSKILDRSANGL